MLHLRTIRKESKTKRKELAKVLNMAEATLCRIEQWVMHLKFDTAVKYLRACKSEERLNELAKFVK